MLKAREVLEDCKISLQMLEEEKDIQKWRIIWAAAVALLRAVGHVLDKVDSENEAIRNSSKLLYKQWKSEAPEHLIFREFIEQERNNLLKEYRVNIHPLDKVQIAVQFTLQPVKGGQPMLANEVYEIDENIYKPLLEGPWAEDDARDVLQEAINWWENQLLTIESSIKKL